MLDQLMKRVRDLEQILLNQEYQNMNMLQSEAKRRWRMDTQPDRLDSLMTAVCVDTRDPLKQGRVRYYHPMISSPNTPVDALPWAWPITNFGGFDDSGATWIPPAGSKLCLLWEYGNRDSAYYIGTTWDRDRGPLGSYNWNYPIEEYQRLWEGKRDGYLLGEDDRQVFHPWNTEMYNGKDITSTSEIIDDPTASERETYPHIYGFKTNGKHRMKLVDGDPKCNNRYSRLEVSTGCGVGLMFKDDHLHPSGQWAFGNASGICSEGERTGDSCGYGKDGMFQNPFFKRKEEMRPYEGAPTPQNNKCALPQSGIWMQALSGHQMVFDDSVEQPKGVPTWNREFDFGCTDRFTGKMYLKSATGHVIEVNDEEAGTGLRGRNNYIRLKTASGIRLELNDHTEGVGKGSCPPNLAGEQRGAVIETSSKHLFKMIDHGNRQCSPFRKEGGEPVAKAKKGYCLLRSGYGLQLLMADYYSQEETQQQFIQLLAPQKDNTIRGPHMFVMQEKPVGPGTVMLRSGGVYYIMSYDDSMEMVGVPGVNEACKFTQVTDSYCVDVNNLYFNHSGMALFDSDTYIILMAGKQELSNPELLNQEAMADVGNALAASESGLQANGSSGRGPYPLVLGKDAWVCPFTQYVHFGLLSVDGEVALNSLSNRVFASSDGETDE